MRLVFLILHFLALEDTIECVESIKKNVDQTTENIFSIVIVDNGSFNSSYENLKEYFNSDKDIHIIRSEKNLGFSKGNNLGFCYAKEKLNPDFIIMINNDTIIKQRDFCEKIIEKYNKYKFYVLGPDIITLDNRHQNPFIRDIMSKKQIKFFRIKQYIRILLLHINLDQFLFRVLRRNESELVVKSGDILDVVLHGACLIFSKEYVDKFDGLNPDTFLFFEEDILRLYSKKYNFLMMYSSDLQIIHKEDISTNMLYKKSKQKLVNQYKYRIDS